MFQTRFFGSVVALTIISLATCDQVGGCHAMRPDTPLYVIVTSHKDIHVELDILAHHTILRPVMCASFTFCCLPLYNFMFDAVGTA